MSRHSAFPIAAIALCAVATACKMKQQGPAADKAQVSAQGEPATAVARSPDISHATTDTSGMARMDSLIRNDSVARDTSQTANHR